MVFLTLVYAVAMVGLGAGMYWLAGSGMIEGATQSWTALIPAFAAVPFVLFAVMSIIKPSSRKHMMHGAALFALVLTAGGLYMSISGLVRAGFSVSELPRPLATLATGLMGVLSLAYLVMCVRSFIAARRARKA